MSVELESGKRIAALIAAANTATGGNAANLTTAVSALIAGFGKGGGTSGVKVTEYVVTEDADRSLWLNEQKIKLVKGVNLLVSSKLDYKGADQTIVQGAMTLMLMLWDGVACTANASANPASAKSHIRGFQVPCSAYSSLASITVIVTGNTSAVTVAEDGLLTFTTSATGVTTGNYNNSFIEGGYTYRLIQAESEVVC